MKTIEINPDQIITLNDYPVYSDNDLKKYFKMCQLKKKYLDNKLLKVFKKFEEKNPAAEYFILDGTHRTTALTLAGCRITIILYEKVLESKE